MPWRTSRQSTTHLKHLLLVRDLRKIVQVIAAEDLRGLIRDIPDFPEPGILFKDITPLMADAAALDAAVCGLSEYARPLGVECVLGG